MYIKMLEYCCMSKRGEAMEQTMINFRIDRELKESMEKVCKEMGMSMTTAFTIFAKKVSREGRIPFEVSADPFYSEENINELKRRIALIESNKTKLTPHELIEE